MKKRYPHLDEFFGAAVGGFAMGVGLLVVLVALTATGDITWLGRSALVFFGIATVLAGLRS